MQKMLLFLEARGYQKVSLSVQKENRAWHLYRNMGFEIVKETDEEWIMARRLGGKEEEKNDCQTERSGKSGTAF